ncbi:MAG TPA: LysM peptidoglycan-binding domain-containing protein, partial [Terriglobales bacterium]|nr:LysM peptidoglycan-binding domain-containing protein [Terriglobales bacterium]
PSHAPKIQEKIVPKADPVEALIAKVEREYQTGQSNYNAGHLEAAKENFDQAFNILLQGPPEVKSDERLEQEFDRLVEGVHNLELLALKEGDGFTQQPAEPAPIDEANEVTFPVDPNVRAKAQEELKTTQSDLPLTLNDSVASYISYFSNRGRHFLEHGYVRSGRYREMISRILKEEGVPQDLIYLAQAESGFHPLALSRAGARGMWQFMAGRGIGYGLQRNWWVDDRQDPEKATRAAARHLKDLYAQFGDWYLAMAAYNSGPGTVQKAVQRTGYADYWELYRRGVLPAETRNYVPIILAITIMSKNPTQYGLDRLRAEQDVRYETVTVDYPVDLRLVSECVDASLATLQELNPSLIRLTTPKEQKFALHLPLGTKDKYQEAIAAIPVDKRVWWHYHKVTPGDTLATVARKYRTTAEAIAEANNLDGEDLGRRGRLVIPVAPSKRSEGDAVAFSKKATRYTVRKGDTVLSVADDFGVPAANVRKWNRIKGNALKAGRVLTIHRPIAVAEGSARGERGAASERSGRKGKLVEVADSESDNSDEATPGPCTKWVTKGKGRRTKRVCVAHAPAAKSRSAKEEKSSAKRRGTRSVDDEDSQRTRGKEGSSRHVRTVEDGSTSDVHTQARGKNTRQEAKRVVRHKVKKGETLSSIASAYNTTVTALKRDNRHVAASLKAGSVLVIKSEE